MYKRDYLCKKAKKTGNKALYTEYRQARNKVVNDIRKAISDHYTSQINQSKSAKEMWEVIRSFIKINKSAPSPISAEINAADSTLKQVEAILQIDVDNMVKWF